MGCFFKLTNQKYEITEITTVITYLKSTIVPKINLEIKISCYIFMISF